MFFEANSHAISEPCPLSNFCAKVVFFCELSISFHKKSLFARIYNPSTCIFCLRGRWYYVGVLNKIKENLNICTKIEKFYVTLR